MNYEDFKQHGLSLAELVRRFLLFISFIDLQSAHSKHAIFDII
jgi:hypothetical protein